jgi:hypothetical protein
MSDENRVTKPENTLAPAVGVTSAVPTPLPVVQRLKSLAAAKG